MNNVNKTLYIPLYGKAYVSKKNIILRDKKAEEIWEQVQFPLKGKSKSKWLAYYMAMRAAIYDEWLDQQLEEDSNQVVLHIGCGLDSRTLRVSNQIVKWYDIDFPEVIQERHKYYAETDRYQMLGTDMSTNEWKELIDGNRDALIVMEGVSMYFAPQELALAANLKFVKEYDMTPQKYIDELQGTERSIFRNLYAGGIAKSLYKMFEYITI